MATVLRGKYAGKSFKINQFCNDWITLYGITQPLAITNVRFTMSEMSEFVKDGTNVGMMFDRFKLDVKKRCFVRKRPIWKP